MIGEDEVMAEKQIAQRKASLVEDIGQEERAYDQLQQKYPSEQEVFQSTKSSCEQKTKVGEQAVYS